MPKLPYRAANAKSTMLFSFSPRCEIIRKPLKSTFPLFHTETDIKAKVLFLDGNPKAYNIDKLLEFLSCPCTIYMIYLLGVDEDGYIVSRLCSALDPRLIEATNIQHHCAGRNTRGVTQFAGYALHSILLSDESTWINPDIAHEFLEELIER